MAVMTNSGYHTPVLLHAAVDSLNIQPHGVYVDVTFGGGGHSREILSHLSPEAQLIAFDQDPDAAVNAARMQDPRFTFIDRNFLDITSALREKGITQVDGILADLGVSGHQFDTPERGFSFRFDAPLDMRMDQHQALSAFEVVNQYAHGDLARVLRLYGELQNASPLASRILQAREETPIRTTHALIETVRKLIPRQQEKQFLARLFQALRMEVNAELHVLESFLMQCAGIIRPQGRLVIISYHSLEDRLVKYYLRSGDLTGEPKKDLYGNVIRPFEEITRKAIVPDQHELEQNPRSRSAKLRVGVRVSNEQDQR